jgi:hypothetical protein
MMESNPLEEIDWSEVRGLNVDVGELCIRLTLDNGQERRVPFRTKQELDKKFRDWVKKSGS